jgi:hypothetical protein
VANSTHCPQWDTIHPASRLPNLLNLNNIDIGLQTAISFAVTGGRNSLAIAVLVEELIFGKVFGLFFARQAVRVESGQKR